MGAVLVARRHSSTNRRTSLAFPCPCLSVGGERYWLDDKDEALLKESNREFEQMSPLEQLFFAHFEAASPSQQDGEWMTVMDIFNYLQSKSKDKLPINKVNMFGRSLQKWNLVHKRVAKGSLYYLKKQ